jgi:hypothetical protein
MEPELEPFIWSKATGQDLPSYVFDASTNTLFNSSIDASIDASKTLRPLNPCVFPAIVWPENKTTSCDLTTFDYITLKLLVSKSFSFVTESGKLFYTNPKSYGTVNIEQFTKRFNILEFWKNANNSNPENLITHSFLYMFVSKRIQRVTPKIRFQHLNEVLSNIFLDDNRKTIFLLLFGLIHKTYRSFAKIANLYKYKKSKTQIACDLYMNPLEENDKRVMTIIQSNTKYLFSVTDLVNMWNSSLTNAPYFYADPIAFKNPYSNVPFNKSTLYNIYFFIKRQSFIMPSMIHNYFLTNFHLKQFRNENENTIREHRVRNYIYHNEHTAKLCSLVKIMLADVRIKPGLRIHADFPKETLAEAMKPYLYLWFLYKHSSDSLYKYDSLKKLKTLMTHFIRYNPLFGRKHIIFIPNDDFLKYKKGNRMKYKTVFNDKYLKYQHHSENNFDSGHLQIDESDEYEFENNNNNNNINMVDGVILNEDNVSNSEPIYYDGDDEDENGDEYEDGNVNDGDDEDEDGDDNNNVNGSTPSNLATMAIINSPDYSSGHDETDSSTEESSTDNEVVIESEEESDTDSQS